MILKPMTGAYPSPGEPPPLEEVLIGCKRSNEFLFDQDPSYEGKLYYDENKLFVKDYFLRVLKGYRELEGIREGSKG